MTPRHSWPRPGWIPATLLSLALGGAPRAQGTPWLHPDGTTHWYQAVAMPNGVTWEDANRFANEAGGYLATITSSAENAFVYGLVTDPAHWRQKGARLHGPWLGGLQPAGSIEPAGGWLWAEREPFAYTNWSPGNPANLGGADRLRFGTGTAVAANWSDAPADTQAGGFVIERSGATVPRTVGLVQREPASYDGYSLFAPLFSLSTYLIDPHGRVVNSWLATEGPGISVYLLPNGDLLRPSHPANPAFAIGGVGGRIERYDWNGQLQWSYLHSTATECQHHDVHMLPNGNVLFIAWHVKTVPEAIAAGRNPQFLLHPRLLPDKIVEVRPTGPTTAQVVWEWTVWDHLIQDFDAAQANYGDVAAHPELVDINYPPLGRLGGGIDDWMHANAVSYNAALDQIILSVRHFNEFWIIDHSTTTAEAASHAGGRSGRGGDLLYRWGNPEAYRAGTAADRQLFQQHNADWIAPGLPGAGNVLVFDNGLERPGPGYSTVVEVTPPAPDARGNYPRPSPAFGPREPTWRYVAAEPTSFYSQFVGGAQRLPNGNTLICSGWQGVSFEVTPAREVVWSFVTPVDGTSPARQGQQPANNQVFRMTRYAADHPAFAGRGLRPGEPIEQQAPVLRADGATLPTWVGVGDAVALTLQAPADALLPYLVGTSTTRGLVPVDHRFLRVGYDSLLVDSLTGAWPAMFQDYFGTLDANGNATATLAVPPYPALAGLTMHTTFLVLDAAAPNGMRTMGNAVTITISP